MHFRSIINSRIVQILLFWTISFLVLLRIFTRTDEIREIDLIYTSLFHIPLIFAVIVHSQSIKLFLDKGRYFIYVSGFLISLLISITVYPLVFNFLSDLLFSDYYFIAVYDWYEIAGITLIYLVVTLLLHLARGWFRQQETILKLSHAQEEKVKAELQALRAQVNPHFLFNSLNLIYGEALKKTDKAPALILKLSEILRYVVDNSEKELVSLADELQYTDKFISIQKERLNYPENVRFTVTGEPGALKIAPLLLITFVENCFKHGAISEAHDLIFISISIDGGRLTMKTENVINKESTSLEPSNSTGIHNAKRRLSLVYPDSHELQFHTRENKFYLTLTLTLN